MKKIILAALLSSLPLITEAAKWVDVTPIMSYDESSLVTSKTDDDFLLIETWIRIYNPTPEDETYGDTGYMKVKNLIRCGYKKEIMSLRFVRYKIYGELIDDLSVPAHRATWKDVVPGSGIEKLATTMCRIAYNKHMRPQKQQAPKQQTQNSSGAQGRWDL